MIVRLVKMTFRDEEVPRFQQLFDGWRRRIIAFHGCHKLELLHDASDPRIFFTHSEWESAADLDAYRNSPVFGDVWPVVKPLFAAPVEAWSLEREHTMVATPPQTDRKPPLA